MTTAALAKAHNHPRHRRQQASLVENSHSVTSIRHPGLVSRRISQPGVSPDISIWHLAGYLSLAYRLAGMLALNINLASRPGG